jgi:hypothetical protein
VCSEKISKVAHSKNGNFRRQLRATLKAITLNYCLAKEELQIIKKRWR